MIKSPKHLIKKNLAEHNRILEESIEEIESKAVLFSQQIIKCIKKGGKILIAGNGGSAADSQHFSTELTVRLRKNRVALPALSLATDMSAVTAIGNDFHFDKIFSRQVEALAKKEDIFIGISTSGNSKNILETFKYCKVKKIKSIGIFGNKGGLCTRYCKNFFSLKSKDASRVQEVHIIFWQNICEIVENYFHKNGKV
jgi:D-sedoheptulose 7-phosphate isomerase